MRLLTESGDVLTTEDGDPLIREWLIVHGQDLTVTVAPPVLRGTETTGPVLERVHA